MPPPRAPPAPGFTLPRPLFSRSYEVNLPSSLTEDHPFALAVSCQPTCVGLRYGRQNSSRRGFSRRPGPAYSGPCGPCPTPHAPGTFSPSPRYEQEPPLSSWEAMRPLRGPPFTQTALWRCRNVDLLSIAYALRPRLRPD